MKALFALLLFCVLTGFADAADPAPPRDALAPTSKLEDALASPLRRVVISTNSLAESLLFYQGAMGLQVAGPIALNQKERAKKIEIWALDKREPWQLYRLYRTNVPDAVEIELVVFDRIKPPIQSSWNPLTLGPLSLGFPNADQISRDKAVRALGFGALNTLEVYPVPRPDGTQYRIEETIFTAPDFVRAVGIHRGDGQTQLGPLDANGQGGPAYAAMVVQDASKMIAFMTEVLGWEVRSDRTWKSAGSKGALNVPDGTEFRFAILYSKGASSGHVLLMQFLNVEAKSSAAPAQVGNRGIGMWVMQANAKALKTIRANAEKFGAPVRRLNLGKAYESMILTAPNGFQVLVEVGK